MHKTVEISEIFTSLEGEHIHTGVPTVYIRFARCNKKCPSWNNPTLSTTTEGYAPISFIPTEYNDLKALPLISMGCDSQYSVNPAFAHLWKKYDATALLQQVIESIPFHAWVHPVTHQPVILSLTGGEPTLRMKFIINELLPHPQMQGCKHILFETNCSVPLRQSDVDQLYNWLDENDCAITWSNSPKLSDSGELWGKSIIPAIAMTQRNEHFIQKSPHKFFQYFKFVSDGSNLSEIKKAMNEYYAAGIPHSCEVALMPTACSKEQQDIIMTDVANLCIREGYRFSIRLQNILWGNGVGT